MAITISSVIKMIRFGIVRVRNLSFTINDVAVIIISAAYIIPITNDPC